MDGKPIGNQQQVSMGMPGMGGMPGMNVDMQAKGFDKDGKPIAGQKQEAGMNFMGMDINMQASGFDKDGKPIPGQKQEAKMNFMGMDINMQASGVDKDGKPLPGQIPSGNLSMGGMPNLQGFGNMMNNMGQFWIHCVNILWAYIQEC